MLNSIVRFAALLVTALAAIGCTSLDRRPSIGTTTGEIYFGSPRISARERLINDRREQEEWLQELLKESRSIRIESSAMLDTRSLAANSIGLQARLDPANAVYRAQQDSDKALVRQQGLSALSAEQARSAAMDQINSAVAKGALTEKDAVERLAAWGVTLAGLSTGPRTASAPGSKGPSPLTSGGPLLGSEKLAALGAPTPASAASAAVTVSPIDAFRDRLAYREEIRAELNENALDETHDLHTNTLYRLTLDATVLPHNDTSAWAVVTASFDAPEAKARLWEDYRVHLEQRFRDRFQERARALLTAAADCSQQDIGNRLKCAAEDTFPPFLANRVLAGVNSYLSGETQARAMSEVTPRAALVHGPTGQSESLDVGSSAGAKLLGVVLQSLAAVAKTEFQEERLFCFYRLESESGAPFPPVSAFSSVSKYGPRFLPPDYDDAVMSAVRSKQCHYKDGVANAEGLIREFLAAVSQRAAPRVYAVTPKESVQRISDVSSRRAASEFLLGLSALAGSGAIDSMVQAARSNDVFMQATRRQPLVVGFTDTGTSVYSSGGGSEPSKKRASFGWILGPTFVMNKDGSSPEFRHVVRQQALTATVSVPSWWESIRLSVRGDWKSEGGQQLATPNSDLSRDYEVALPRRLSGLDGFLVDGTTSRAPNVSTVYRTTVKVGAPMTLLLRADNAWRSAEVYVGAQRADSVRLTADMGGVIAEFRCIQPFLSLAPEGAKPRIVDVTLGTSEGLVVVGSATVMPADGDAGKRAEACSGASERSAAATAPAAK